MSQNDLTPLQRAFLALETTRARLDSLERAQREPIAIVGLGCRTPADGDDAETLWRILREGRDGVCPVPADRWDGERLYSADPDTPGKMVTREGGFLRDIAGFDSELFGLSPREAQGMDPQQRLLLEVAWEALENAGIAPDRLEGSRTGVYAGIASNDYLHLMLQSGDPALVDAHFMSGIAHSMASGRLSYLLGLQGPSLSIDTACSSSLVAVHLATRALRNRECDLALAAGVNIMVSPDINIAYSRARMLSPDGRCRTFDAEASGIVRGEGCGVVVLRRLSDALAMGDRILAVVRGSAVNQDGPSSSLTAPNGPAQEAVIRAALADAGVAPGDVDYVEAHGTGTPLGDPLEMRALGAVFGAERPRERPLYVGSLKTNFGHLEAAAGVVALIKVVLSLQHGEIPPHLHFHTPSPHIPWDELPVTVPRGAVPWPADGRPRVAGVSAFGFSGTNAHVVLEQAPAPAPRTAQVDRPLHVLTLSAKGSAALEAQARRLSAALANEGDGALADVAFTLNTGRAALPERAALTAATVEEVRSQLDALAAGADAPGLSRGRVKAGARPRVAFLFTGQGAQFARMGHALYETSPTFRAALDECATHLDPELPRPLLDVLFSPDDPALHQTGFAQPALFALEYALATLWMRWGIVPVAAIGHSVGEIAAACVGGVLSLRDAARLIAARGRRMQALPAGGGMRAVFAPEDAVRAAVQETGGVLDVAAVNGPAHTVVSGALPDLERLAEALARRGITSKPLVVSHAFHSALMEPALDAFERDLEEAHLAYGAPSLRLVSNVTGAVADGAQMRSARYWRDHIRQPVQFARGMSALASLGCDAMLEIGPAPTLTTLGQQCLGAERATWCVSMRRARPEWEQLLESVRSLHLIGAPLDWAAFDADYPRARRALPTYPFQRTRHWFRARPAAARTVDEPGAHPLLGRRVPSPLPQAQFEAWLSPETPAFIGDHRVGGAVLLPGTASVELAVAAARAVFGPGSHVVEGLTWRAAMQFDGAELRRVHTIVEPRTGSTAAFRIESCAAEGGMWTLHTEGVLRLDDAGAQSSAAGELAAARERCRTPYDLTALYETQVRQGYEFGPALHGVRSVHRGDGEAIGEIVLPDDESLNAVMYGIHPALLDACVQVVGAIMPAEDAQQRALFLPVTVRTFVLHRSPGGRCTSHVQLAANTDPSAPQREATIRLYDDDGSLLAEMEGLVLQRVASDFLKQPGDSHEREDLYEVRWAPAPLVAREGAQDAGALARLAAAGLDRLAAEHGLAAVDRYLPRLETVAGRIAEHALAELGWGPATPALPADALAETLGVAPAHRRLIGRLLEIVAEKNGAVRDGDAWCATRELRRVDVEEELAALAREAPDAAELAWVRCTASGFVDALRGACDPLQLLFPNGSAETAERLYTESPLAHVYNTMLADAFEAILAAAPRERPLRVLEIGGGTGGTTSHVAPRVNGRAVEYTFTDLGDSFVMRARRKFAAYPFMRYHTLDIERDPVEQGMTPGSFDVIIAANVLHATADIRRTVHHARGLLAEGGTLLLLEITRPQRWFDLTVGLTEGWWRFADSDLRQSYTTLREEQWRDVLQSAGLDVATVVPRDTSSWSLARQQIVVARAPESANATSSRVGAWLILQDDARLGAAFASALRARGHRCITVSAEAGNGAGGADASPADQAMDALVLGGDDVEAYRAVLRSARAQVGPRFGVVDLRWLDTREWREAPSVHAALRTPVARSLGLLRAVLDECADAPPRYVLVTRGAQPAGTVAAPLAPYRAAAWGLGRTVALEHPELRPLLVDLDPAVDTDEISMLVDEVLADSVEGQVAFRGGARLVARLTRFASSPTASEPVPAGDNERLTAAQRGTLDGVVVASCERPAPGAGEVEIVVQATGLNFRDVLNVLGMYPGDPGPPGAECAGVVTRIGDGVDGLAVGDAVVATASACFSRFVIARRAMVHRMPPNLSFAEAAALPVAFVTAAYALLDVGRLAVGERVLIHAGAGGVGLAAIRLAQRVGAEVFATAGSETKRAYLRKIGVRHVYDSRRPGFAEAIASATGGRGVDVVLNSLSGDAIAESVRALAAGGRFLEIGKRGIWTPEQMAQAGRAIEYHVLDVGAAGETDPETLRRRFEEILNDVGSGALPALPVTVFPWDGWADAFRHMMQARQIGKIVVLRPAARPESFVRADGSYLITGGLSGLGLLVAQWLAERGARHLTLVSRRGVTAEAEPVLAALRAQGVTVHAESADVADDAAMAALLARSGAESPPLRGVVHAAGALDDGALVSQTWSRFETVLAAKVAGARALDRLTADAPLDWMMIFSSAAAMIGSAGQANHAAANAILDVLAHERRRLGRRTVSIDWGPWSSVGAAADRAMQERVGALGLHAMTPAEGLAHLATIVADDATQVGAMKADWAQWLERRGTPELQVFVGPLATRRTVQTPSVEQARAPDRVPSLRARIESTPVARRRVVLAAFVREQVQRILGMPAGAPLDDRAPLGDLGLDSLLAVELRNTLGKAVDAGLPATLLFDHPSIDALTDYLATTVIGIQVTEPAGPVEAAAQSATDLADELLRNIEALPDDEVTRLLTRETLS